MKNKFLFLLSILIVNSAFCADFYNEKEVEFRLFEQPTTSISFIVNKKQTIRDLIHAFNERYRNIIHYEADKLYLYNAALKKYVLLNLDETVEQSGIWNFQNYHLFLGQTPFIYGTHQLFFKQRSKQVMIRTIGGITINVSVCYSKTLTNFINKIKKEFGKQDLIIAQDSNIKLLYKEREIQNCRHIGQIDGLMEDENPVITVIVVP